MTIPRTSLLATLVDSYGVIHSRSLRSYDPCFARFYMCLLSLCLKNNTFETFCIFCPYILKNILSSSNPLGLQPLPLYFPCGKHRGRKCYPLRVLLLRHKDMLFMWDILLFLLSLCLYKDNRAEHGLRGFMPRNRVTPYECRRHEVRGCKPTTDTGVCKTRKVQTPVFQTIAW